jgi:uncharacterized membrane protein YqjE
VSGWWSLPQAAPVLLRHLSAYAELMGQDLAVAQRQITARLVALALIAYAGFFTIMMICLAIVAAAWDTSARLTAIYCLIALFAVLLAIGIAYLARINARSRMLLASVRREWAVDRVILDELLSGKRAESPDTGARSGGNGSAGEHHAGGSNA